MFFIDKTIWLLLGNVIFLSASALARPALY